MRRRQRLGGHTWEFGDLVQLMGAASPARSGDGLAGCAAGSTAERAAAQYALADVPLQAFLDEPLVDDATDDVTRLILDSHDGAAFAAVATLSVGELRDWLMAAGARRDAAALATLAPGLTPEMVAAVSKLMTIGEMLAVSAAIEVTTAFRTTIGLPGTLATRLQPNHPTDDPAGILAATLDGLLLGCGDAVLGINPAGDSPRAVRTLLELLDELRTHLEVPTQSCVLTHVTTTLQLMEQGAPVDLVFQSIAGTQGANEAFGVRLDMLGEAQQAALALGRGTVGSNVMYFETGQGSALSSGCHLGVGGRPVDQQTLEARAYGVARAFDPLLVNTVVGFIGPEFLYDGKQIIRAGVEDNFCGRLLGLPMGVDVCHTFHAEADTDDMQTLLTLLVAASTGFVITVPGADDVMLGYQSLSFHDALVARRTAGLRPAPEFEQWLATNQMLDGGGGIEERDPRGWLTGGALRELATSGQVAR